MTITKKRLNTMLGQINCEEHFIWDAHVHLWGAPYHAKEDPDLILKDEELSIREASRFRSAGGSVVVEFSTYDFGRDWSVLKRISEKTGVHILAGSGFYRSAGLDRLLSRHSDEEWVSLMVSEWKDGEALSGAKPSFLKWSTSLDTITDAEQRSARMIARAHSETGLPIVTHTQRGTMVKEQMMLLKNLGVSLSSVLISHIDMRPELTAADFLEVLDEGGNVSFDQLGKPKYGEESDKISLILELCARGFSQNIFLATDIGRRSNLKELNGTPGLEHIPAEVVPKLFQAGASEKLVRQLVSENPGNFYGV